MYGAYESRCNCSKFFISESPLAPKGGWYTYAVREQIIKSLVRDHMPYSRVKERMRDDFCIDISIGIMWKWFNDEAEQVHFFKEFEQWSTALFSGVVCIDEVYEGTWRIFMATDCISDIPIAFMVAEKADEEALDKFLDTLSGRGIIPEVIITDGSPLYKESLRERWKDVKHQLCIFHVLKGFNKVIVDCVRALKNRISRQGNKGRKRKRGRPSKQAQYQRNRNKRKKEEARFIWKHQYLLVKKKCRWTKEDKEAFRRLCRIAPTLKHVRDLVEKFHSLFERGISQQQARYRRTKLLNNPYSQKLSCFKRIANMIPKEKFEKMIVFLSYENLDRTSNHVERTNRRFRMLQKTRYKRRTVRTIVNALMHEWVYLMKLHPLYGKPLKKLRSCFNVAGISDRASVKKVA